MKLYEAKERLNITIKAFDNLTSEEILQLSMEADQFIVIEQRARLERALGEITNRT